MAALKWPQAMVVVLAAAGVGALAGSTRTPPAAPAAIVEGLTGDWQLGTYETDTVAMVDAAGGEVTVTGGDLDGLRLELPQDAVADGTSVTVEHADIRSHTWGRAVQPVTPAIRVTVGDGANTAAAMTVTVPLDLREGQQALGLFVHDDGSLEGMPLASGDRTRITLATEHFSEWFVSAFDPAWLPDTIMTGFTPGRDNWQFLNQGSWTSPGGICAGMAASSMWYYLEVTKELDGVAPELYGWFDYPHGTRTAGFTDDDAHAVRFASMVHEDGRWGSSLRKGVYVGQGQVWDFYRDARDARADTWQYQAFRYSMYVSGEPQLMLLSKAPRKGGHAVVAYGVTNGAISVGRSERAGGYVWISDPNHPTHADVVAYDATTSAFRPYQGALQAGGTVEGYGYVGYAAKSALFDWDQIGIRYQQAVDGSIGTGTFPDLLIFQMTPDPVTGVSTRMLTTAPAVDAYGTVLLSFAVEPAEPGMGTWVRIYEDGGTQPIAESISYATAASGGAANVKSNALLSPGLGGGTFKVIVMVGRSSGNPAQVTWEFVDALPLVVGPASAVPTTTTTTTTPVTLPPVTAPPTTMPATPPPTAPPVTIDCSNCPPGVAGLQCRLQCQAIPEAGTNGAGG